MTSKHCIATVAVFAVALAGVLARDASARATVTPCELLTQAQIASAVGATFAAGAPIGTTGCSWSATQQVGSKNPIVTVSLWPGSGWSKMQQPFPGATNSPVSGIGDGALFRTIGGYTTLSVLKGSTIVVVKIYGIQAQDKTESIEKTLASDVMTKM